MNMYMLYGTRLILLLLLPHHSFEASISADNGQTTLKLLFALWRHGDRAPSGTYPKDPYKDSEYLPEGLGNLNVAGKARAYDLGLFIRQRYGSFLGTELLPGLAVTRSTNVPRTIESGQLVMAGAFAPLADDERWTSGNSSLGQEWNPVAFTTFDTDKEFVLDGSYLDCPATDADLALGSKVGYDRLQKVLDTNARNVIAEDAGVNVSSLHDVAYLCYSLVCQASCGLELPTWSSQVYPEPLCTALDLYMGASTYTALQRKVAGGAFLNELLTQSEAFQSQQLPARRKLYAYSGHDSTEVSVLSALGVWDGVSPAFSTAIFIELRQQGTDGQLGLQVYYRNDTSKDPVLLTLPGCDAFCPLSKFRTLYKDNAATSEELAILCHDGSVGSGALTSEPLMLVLASLVASGIQLALEL